MSRLIRIVTPKERKQLKADIKLIIATRKEKGLTQAALAKLIGKSTSNIGNVESGHLLPNKSWIKKVKSALKIKLKA